MGRLGDGWLASFLTPAEARVSRLDIQAAAAEAGREVEPDHFGISLAVGPDGLPPELVEVIGLRRPGVAPADLAAGSWPDARRLIEEYIAAGLSKFVIRPAGRSDDLQFIDEFVTELMRLQT